MYSQLRNFFGTGVLFLFFLAVTLGGSGIAEAGVKEVTPANVAAAAAKANADKAAGADDVKTIQDIVDDNANYDEDDEENVLEFGAGEYENVGEILIRPNRAGLILRPAEGAEVVFKGKVLINVKADDVVVEGLTFMNVTVPDAVTMTIDRDTATAGDQTVMYGFPGKTIKEMLEADGFTNVVLTPAFINPKMDNSGGLYISWNEQKFITVAGSDTASNNGRVASRVTGAPVPGARSAQTASPLYGIHSSVVADRAKGVLGVIWVDSVPDDGTCEMSTGDTPRELPEIKGVKIRNNMFDGTETAGVRAGSMKTLAMTAGTSCRVELDVIGNTFRNIGGTGGFVKVGSVMNMPPDALDADGNRVAEYGNIAPAISVAYAAGTSSDKTVIASNTIEGGLGDGVELRWTPKGQKVEIRNNMVTDTPLDGITVIGASFDSDDTTTEISIMGNVIVGTSTNRYITIPGYTAGISSGINPVIYGRITAVPASYNDFAYPFVGWGAASQAWLTGASGCVGGAASSTDAEKEALVKKVGLELWRSSRSASSGGPDFGHGGVFLPSYTATGRTAVAGTGSVYDGSEASAGYSALFRLKADECFELGRIKVYEQAGVSITNNNLGYYETDTPENRGDVIDFGVVIDGSSTKLAAFSGNNVDRFVENSIKNNGASFSVAGNYLSPRTPRISGTVTGRDDLRDTPSEAGTRGVVPQEVMPDTSAPVLGRLGAGAPKLADGKTLTLTFVDEGMLEDNDPAANAFSVMVSSGGGARTVYDVMTVTVNPNTVVLTLEGTVDATTGITVSYTKPSSGDVLMDTVGNEVASFSGVAVTVEATTPPPPPPPPPAATGDGGCALASAGSAGADMGMLLPLMLAGLAFILGRKARRVS